MKKLIFTVLILVIASGLILWSKGNTMRDIRTEIEIEAPPAEVWGILKDIDSWEEWSPIINQSSGDTTLGSELTITMVGEEEGKDGPKYNPVITVLQEPRLFRWRAHMISEFLFTNDKVFELEATDSGTRLVHKELFKGMLMPLFWGKLNSHVPSMLNSMNAALKTKAEKGSN